MIVPRRSRPEHRRAAGRRSAFTLVEMLVSVAIVALMMVLFAQVFSLAGSSVGRQKGIARNDSRTRTILNILRNDLNDRTFKTVVPFHEDESDVYGSNDPLRFELRRGFFYVSENDPDSGTDDVLQFVIQVDPDDPVYGRAKKYPTPMEPDDRNDPDWDDGQYPNSAGSSQYAVVCYFLRRGVLYRRVFLVRAPLDGSAVTPTDWLDVQNSYEFWRDFDYSVHKDFGGSADVVWHGVSAGEDWLDNDPSNNLSIGDPRFRYGHNFVDGNPREFVPEADWNGTSGLQPEEDANGNGTLDAAVFFGRYTHEETSHLQFDWPGVGANNPFDPTDTTRDEALTAKGVVRPYHDGQRLRRGEDILMQHVHEFDVKVFDDAVGQFVDVGTGTGDFADHGTAQPYRSNAPDSKHGDNIFDTWHPGLGEEPPYRPDDGGTPATATPLRALQVRLRFFDPESGQMRQMTLRHSLLPE
jgi:prepilin-type N-terminal cleavage/methylation domain-containing protein